jgi:DNA-binding MarR family transcriptional regulator
VQATTDTARCLVEFLRFLTQSAGNAFVQAVEDAGLSLTQLKAMHILAASDEELSLNGLAERLGGLSLQRGYVRRAEDSADRRVKRLSLTAKGRRTIDRLIEIRVKELGGVLETLTDGERERLARALEPILEKRA